MGPILILLNLSKRLSNFLELIDIIILFEYLIWHVECFILPLIITLKLFIMINWFKRIGIASSLYKWLIWRSIHMSIGLKCFKFICRTLVEPLKELWTCFSKGRSFTCPKWILFRIIGPCDQGRLMPLLMFILSVLQSIIVSFETVKVIIWLHAFILHID